MTPAAAVFITTVVIDTDSAAYLNGNPALVKLIVAPCRVVLILPLDSTDGRRPASRARPS